MSSLANQLAGIASLDATRLTSKYGAPSSKSYLFPPSVASTHDLDSIFALAQSGYEELLDLDEGMGEYDELFSESSKGADRMMLNESENEELSRVLERCLRRLGRWVGVMAGGKCIEWLVRRYRVHEMNAETLLRVFLPYHQSPNFPRVLAILTLPQTSPYHAPFSALIKNPQPIPRTYITTSISPARDKSLHLLNDVSGSIHQAVQEGVVHRALLTFWTATMVDLLESVRKGGAAHEGMVKLLVETFVVLLSTPHAGEDVNAAVYPPLVLLTRAIPLADEPFQAILSALLTPKSGANAPQRILTLLVVLNDRPNYNLGLGANAAAHLTKVKSLGSILVASMEKYGFENALRTTLPALIDRPDLHHKTLRAIFDVRTLSQTLASTAAESLLKVGSAATSEEIKAASKSLLANLRERHPSVVDSVFVQSSSNGDSSIDRDLITKPAEEVAFLNIYSADITSRVQGIRDILASPDEQDASSAEAIVARLGDSDEAVLRVLYEKPSDLLNLISVEQYIAGVKPVFSGVSPRPVIIGIHLDFISSHLLSEPRKNDPTATSVFRELLFPCLLSTEKRQPFTKAEAVKLLEGGFKTIHLLGGIGPAINKARTETENVKGGAERSNLLISKALAESLAKSSDIADDVAFLLSQLSASLPSARLLAHLVVAQLISVLHGQKQLDVAVKLLLHLRKERNNSFRAVEKAEDPFSTAYLEAIYRKPSESQTAQRAILSLLAAMTTVVRPAEPLDFLSADFAPSPSYKTFANEIYIWSNAGSLPTGLAQNLLRSLFAQLGEDALLFFASIWSGPTADASLRTASLRHASAFVAAYASDSGSTMDFQIVLPALLVALQDSEKSKSARASAVQVLRAISRSVDPNAGVYALDTIYGDKSEGVQLLKPSDRKKYLDALVEVSDEMVLDAGRVQSAHTTIFGRGKEALQKQRRAVIGCLTSHLTAHQSYTHRMVVLQTLEGIKGNVVLRGTLPLLSALQDETSDETIWLAALSAEQRDQYLALLFSGLGTQSVPVLTEENSLGWSFLLSCLAGQSGVQAQLRSLSLDRMADGLFAALPAELKVDYVLALIASLRDLPTDSVLSSAKVLEIFELDAEGIIEIIETYSEPLETTMHRKKARQDEDGAEEDRPTQAVLDLTTLIESRNWASLPGDAQLVASLMSILSSLLARRQVIREGVDYLEQEVLGAILALVSKIDDAAEVQRAHVGIEVIIKVIRASTNPRTSQRALLVASELARLIPEAVLHNVMPIFTFMGASDFQRDDAYSFGVVEKTVSRIVPVMTRSLKDKSTTSLELYNESLTFLSIFTDMAGRLPKHRVLPFFVHLVKSLGPSDFLAPVCMLLVDRATTKAGRAGNSVSVVLELPAGLAGAFDVSVRTEVLLEVVDELGRLVGDLTRTEKEAFLSRTVSENDSSDRPLRQTTHLLTFLLALIGQLQGKPCSQITVTSAVRSLIVLAASTQQSLLSTTDISGLVQKALVGCMQLLSAEAFLAIVSELLGGDNEKDIVMALQIFSQRLPLIKPEVRAKSTKSLSEILKKASSLLNSSKASSMTPTALAAIRAVTATAIPAEDGALAAVVLPIVGVIKTAGTEVLSLLELLIRHLSSRMIPYIQPILDASLALVSSPKSNTLSTKSAFATLSALVEVLSTFVSSKQLTAILTATIGYSAKAESAKKGKAPDVGEKDVSRSLLSTVAKKVRTKSLFPVLMGIWKGVQSEEQAAMKAFFDLLRLTLRNAARDDLPSMIKPIFGFFLDVFDLRHRLQLQAFDAQTINEIEESAIGSFLELVTKLNESTFRPLFVRLYDWAVIDLADGKAIDDSRLIERKIVLLHITKGLLVKFRNLLSPYLSILQPHIDELLPAFADGELTSYPLWELLLDVLGTSFEVDDGAYWSESTLLALTPKLVQQIPLSLAPAVTMHEPSSPISRALASLAGSTTSEPLLKKLNTSICLLTRSDDPPIRLRALDALKAIWNAQSEELIPFVPETVGEFLVELLEDENADVENAAREVLAGIEKVTGSLTEYLE